MVLDIQSVLALQQSKGWGNGNGNGKAVLKEWRVCRQVCVCAPTVLPTREGLFRYRRDCALHVYIEQLQVCHMRWVERIAAIINLVVWLSSTKVDESDIDLFVRINAAERAGWSHRVRRLLSSVGARYRDLPKDSLSLSLS